MGYKPPKHAVKLTFEAHPGLEVRCRPVSTGELLEIVRIADVVRADMALVQDLNEAFARVLRSWNLEDEDEDGNTIEVPATFDGLMSQEFALVEAIVHGWMDSLMGVEPPLDEPSTSGEPSQVLSLPMEPLSDNPPTSAMQS